MKKKNHNIIVTCTEHEQQMRAEAMKVLLELIAKRAQRVADLERRVFYLEQKLEKLKSKLN